MRYKLSDICDYAKGKTDVSDLNNQTYISTENMIPNKGGITVATSLPTTVQAKSFMVGDVLVSNIRPYFKKIWHADFDGGCSNDVLVFHAKNGVNNKYLYYVLANDAFFDYSMATSKGTKMPRGDKTAIMQYDVPDFSYDKQIKIANILDAIDQKIQLNKKINNGKILDTLVNWVSIPLAQLGPVLGAGFMVVVNALINILIPSGSGQAAVVMPLMTPMADIIGITRQVTVQAFQFGDGLSNLITPLNGTLMGGLAMAHVEFPRYFKWVINIIAGQVFVAAIVTMLLQYVGWTGL